MLLSIKKGVQIAQYQLEDKAKVRGASSDLSLFRSINRLLDLNIFTKNQKKEIELTELGCNCKNLLIYDKELFFEYIHHLHVLNAFTSQRRYFLTYFLITKELYNRKNASNYSEIISNVLSDIEMIFGEREESIDTTSVTKVVSWLRVLEPKFVFDDSTLHQREGVKPETIMLAISAYYQKNKIPFGSPIMLYSGSAQEIALLGLTSPAYLLNSIQTVSVRFPILSIGNTVDGKSLLLRRAFEIGDML